MPFPRRYSEPISELTLNFNYADVASGIGFVIYDCFATTEETDGNTVLYHVLPTGTSIESFPKYDSAESGSGSDTYVSKNIDFDSSIFAFPAILKGKALCEFTHDIYTSAAGGTIGYVECTIGIVDSDGNYTEIGSKDSREISASSSANTTETGTVSIDITETPIAPGEKIRIRMIMWKKRTSGSGDTAHNYLVFNTLNSDVVMGHATVTAANNHTYLKWHVPFKIEQ